MTTHQQSTISHLREMGADIEIIANEKNGDVVVLHSQYGGREMHRISASGQITRSKLIEGMKA